MRWAVGSGRWSWSVVCQPIPVVGLINGAHVSDQFKDFHDDFFWRVEMLSFAFRFGLRPSPVAPETQLPAAFALGAQLTVELQR